MKYIPRLLILSGLFLSCAIVSCEKNDDRSIKILPAIGCGQGLLPFDIDEYTTLVTDSVSVADVRLEQTCLIVDFVYSGCSKREVDVMAFIDQSSFVPTLNAKISNGPIEECLAFFMHTDTFNLTSIGLDLYDGTILRVHQWDESFVLEVE